MFSGEEAKDIVVEKHRNVLEELSRETRAREKANEERAKVLGEFITELRNVRYMEKLYFKAYANDSRTFLRSPREFFAVCFVGVVIIGIITALAAIVATNTNYALVFCSWALALLWMFSLATWNSIHTRVFYGRWKQLDKVWDEMQEVIAAWSWKGKMSTAEARAKFAKFKEDDIVGKIGRAKWFRPNHKDAVLTNKYLDCDFTYRCIDICKSAELDPMKTLPECVKKHMNEKGDVIAEHH